jgi:hypothetical protein
VVAILGRETDDGDFDVFDVCLPGLAPQTPISEVDDECDDNSKVSRHG